MSYLFLICNPPNTSACKPPSAMFNPFKTIFIDRLIDGKETVSLLSAPPFTMMPQWKFISFMHAEEKLRPKLEKYGAFTLIYVSGDHFDINTSIVSEEVE